jgi:hypothetical protein
MQNEPGSKNESRIELWPLYSTTELRRSLTIMTIIGAVAGAVVGSVGFSAWSQPNLGAGLLGMIFGAGVCALLTLGMSSFLKTTSAAVVTVLWCALLGMLFSGAFWELHLQTKLQAWAAGLAVGATVGAVGVNRQRLARLVQGRPATSEPATSPAPNTSSRQPGREARSVL